jgi:hypothetical protein
MVLGLLRGLWLSASRPNGDRAADHPLGTGGVERLAAPIRPMLEMRSQGRNLNASNQIASGVRWLFEQLCTKVS